MIKTLFAVASPSQDTYQPFTSLANYPKYYGASRSVSDTTCSLACTLEEQNGNGQVIFICF
jgi:hypothetical protein